MEEGQISFQVRRVYWERGGCSRRGGGGVVVVEEEGQISSQV